MINIYIVYELNTWSRDLNTVFTLKDCLFGGVKLATNADPDKYVHSGFGIAFDSRSGFSLPDGNMTSSVHINKEGKIILILGEGPAEVLDGTTTLTARTEYSINFSRSHRKFCLSLYYNGGNSFFDNATKKY